MKEKLQQCVTEEEVKKVIIEEFKLKKAKIRDRIDLLTNDVLFEFKLDVNMKNKKNQAKVLAQSLTYIKKIITGELTYIVDVPQFICLIDKNEAMIFNVDKYMNFVNDSKYDWKRTPSSPCTLLITELSVFENHSRIYDLTKDHDLEYFTIDMKGILSSKLSPFIKKEITEKNFELVFNCWKKALDGYLVKYSEHEQREIFLKDLNEDLPFHKGDLFYKSDKIAMSKKTYEDFWVYWNRPPKNRAMRLITTKLDQILDQRTQKMTGAFYTPIKLGDLCWEMINEQIPDIDEYYIWDMAAGVGNLVYNMTEYSKVFLSTLDPVDVDLMTKNNYYPEATIFQYDYLNDDIPLIMEGKDLLDDSLGWKLPRSLREILHRKEKLLVLVNPPYGEATPGAYNTSGVQTKHKASISDSTIKQYYVGNKKSMNDILIQFLFRINTELKHSVVGLVCTEKFITYDTCNEFVNKDWCKVFVDGLQISSKTFNLKGSFPIMFSMWR